LILFFTGYLSRLIVAPVHRVAEAAETLARGGLSTRVPEGNVGVIGELARSFNTMASSLEESRDELESQNAELELQTAELEDQQTRLATANDELEAQRNELERAVTDLADEKSRLDLLFGFGEMLAREIEGDELPVNVMRHLGDLAGAEVGALYLARPGEEHELALATTRGIELSRLSQKIVPSQGLAGRALAEGRPVAAAHGNSDLFVESFGAELPVTHELHLPLDTGGRRLGVVSLGRLGDRRFSDEQIEVLENLAGQAAVAVSNAFALAEALRLGDINRAVLDATLDGISLDGPGRVSVSLHTADRGDWVLVNETVGPDGRAAQPPPWFAQCLPGPPAPASGVQVSTSLPPAVAAAGMSNSTGSYGLASQPWTSCPSPAVSRTFRPSWPPYTTRTR